jgi:hypothetical protein
MGERAVTENVLGLYAAMIVAKKRADEIQNEFLRRNTALNAAASRVKGDTYADEDARAFVDAWRNYENRPRHDWFASAATTAFDNAWADLPHDEWEVAFAVGRERFGDKFCDYCTMLDDRQINGVED